MAFYLSNNLNFFSKQKYLITYQGEASECGLACICIIANYYGYKTDLITLRNEFNISLKGAKLSQLINIAERLKLGTKAIRIEPYDLLIVDKPCILHWNLNHYVVLKSANKKNVVILDPKAGERKLSWDQVEKSFTGIALEVFPTAKFQKKENKQKLSLNILWDNITGLKRGLTQILILALGLNVLTLLIPYFMQLSIDKVVINNDKYLLAVLGVGFLLLTVIKVVTATVRAWVVVYLRTTLSMQLATSLFNRMIRISLTWFEKRHVGDIMSRFTSLDQIKEQISSGLIEGLIDGLMASITLALMFVYSVRLTMIALFSTFAYFVVRTFYYRPLKDRTEESILYAAKEDSIFLETIRSMQAVKIFNLESTRQTIWQNTYVDYLNADIRLSKINILYDLFHDLVRGIEYIVLVWIGILLIVGGSLSVGMLFAFFAFHGQFISNTKTFIDKVFDIKMLSLHLSRVADIALTKEEQHLYPKLGTVIDDLPKLELHNISFRYSDDDSYLFQNLSVTVESGECVVIVAPSGFGKTTLLKIMMGLIQPVTGRVLFSGYDIRDIGLNKYRSITGAVMQNDNLMSGSIAQNIGLHATDIDMNLVVECAEKANIMNDIANMPMGMNTLVGDMGNTLSGGQLQRVLIARALYSKPSILFLDEATSHLDSISEKRINQAISQYNITRIIIAHRQETIDIADRVIDLTSLCNVT